jgi:hypothetical protein
MKTTCFALCAAFLFMASSSPTVVRAQGNLIQSGNWQLSGSGAWYGYDGGADGGAFMGPNTLNLSEWFQDLPTTPGQPYLVSFYLRGSYPAQQGPPFAMNVFWNASEVGAYSWNVFSSAWIYESLTVEGGPGSQSVLGFSDPDPTFSAFSVVSVVAVPEPATPIFYAGVAVLLALFRPRSARQSESRQ